MNATALVGGLRWSSTQDIEARVPSFHRWNGRIWLLTAFAASATGLCLVWSRGAFGSVVQRIGSSVDAGLIMVCVVVALHYAIARDSKTHRRRALRLFMVVSGIWFLRAGLMSWILVNTGPVGFNVTAFQGLLLDFLPLASYLLPLAALEVYVRMKAMTK
jgi:hypothetical protein